MPKKYRGTVRIDHSVLPEVLHYIDGTRIVVAVAKVLNYRKDNQPVTYKMEPGRQMAQACHAVSGLKLRYCEAHAMNDDHKLRKLVVQLMESPITTIVLQARDTNEIIQLACLAEEKGLLSFCFYDDNALVYGTTERIPTAIAIGPVNPMQLLGVSSYLPLWKDGISDVG